MSTTKTPAHTATDPRETLVESERDASREHPENFKEEGTEEKIVEILPIDGEGTAIKGIDPGK